MPQQSAQPAFWNPFAAGCNEVAASQAPASPWTCEFDMVGDDAPMQILCAAVRALLANRPARWAEVEIVGVSHAAISVSRGERLGRQDLIHSQIQRSRTRAALYAISHNVYYVKAFASFAGFVCCWANAAEATMARRMEFGTCVIEH